MNNRSKFLLQKKNKKLFKKHDKTNLMADLFVRASVYIFIYFSYVFNFFSFPNKVEFSLLMNRIKNPLIILCYIEI